MGLFVPSIVYGDDSIDEFFTELSKENKIVIVVGENAGEPDIRAAKLLKNYLLNQGLLDVLITTDKLLQESEKYVSHIITIGGSGANSFTKEIESHIPLKIFRGLKIPNSENDPLNPSITTFQFFDVVNHVTYGNPLEQNHGLSFIQLIKHPDYKNKILTIIGIEAIGTTNAVEFMVSNLNNSIFTQNLIVMNYFDEQIELLSLNDNDLFQKANTPLKINKQFENDKITFNLGEKFTTIITLTNTADSDINFMLYDLGYSGMDVHENTLSNNTVTQSDESVIHRDSISAGETKKIVYSGQVWDGTQLGNGVIQGAQLYFTYDNVDYKIQSNDLLVRITDLKNLISNFSFDSDDLKSGQETNMRIEFINTGIHQIYVNSTLTPPHDFQIIPNSMNGIWEEDNTYLLNVEIMPDTTKIFDMKIIAPDYYFGIEPLSYEFSLDVDLHYFDYEENTLSNKLTTVGLEKKHLSVNPLIVFSTETILSLTVPPILGAIGLYIWKKIRNKK